MKTIYSGKIIKEIKRSCYRIITERIPKGYYGNPKEMNITYAVDLKGDYLGDTKMAYRLVNKRGISVFEKTNPKNCVCSIGYNLHKKLWYGWSHRAIHGFKKKQDAIRFSKSVS